MQQEEDERRRLEYLRRHREQIKQRYRLEAERRGEEQEADAAAMRARRDDVRAEDKKEVGGTIRSLSGIYARVGDLAGEELQLLANRYQATTDQTQFNTRGKYHARCMKDAYPIAGSQLKLEKERELENAAKKKLLLSDVSSLAQKSSFGGTRESRGVLSCGLEKMIGKSKLDHYVDQFGAALNAEQERVRRSEAERESQLCGVQHREGLEQFWKLMQAHHYSEVTAWLRFHSFLDVNIPVRLVLDHSTDTVAVCEDRTLGVTPLMAACRSLSVDLVRCLLERGAVVGLTTANGDTAIHFLWRDWTLADSTTSTVKDIASLILRSERVRNILVALIAYGVDVNAQNTFGETALQFCARYDLQDCAKLLLMHGANAFVRDRKGNSAVEYAQIGGFDGLHQLLLHYNTIDRVRAQEIDRREITVLLNQNRGALTATWSQTPQHFLSKLKVEQKRAGHLRNQYIDSKGQVIVCTEEK